MTTALALQSADACNRACVIAAGLAGIEGWLHPAQGFALHELARLGEGDGAVVEIGSFMGLSTCWIAAGLQLRPKKYPVDIPSVYAVDTFKGRIPYATAGGKHDYGCTFPVFEKNLSDRGLRHHVLPMVADSVDTGKRWTRGPIRILFIDAGHEYEEVKADFEAWAPHLEPGAVVAIHDVGDFEGVTRFYGELTGVGWREVLRVGSLGVIQNEIRVKAAETRAALERDPRGRD